MSFPSQLWTLVLTLVNFVIPVCFISHLDAQVVLGVFFVNIVAMTSLTALTGYTLLVSLGHALWLPLIYYFWTRLPELPVDNLFGIWVRALMILNSFALILDSFNVWRYLRGHRDPLESDSGS